MEFDSNKSLEENLLIFREACKKLDEECTNILFDNIDKLQHTGDQIKDRAARLAFNASVKTAVEALPDISAPEL